MKFYVISTTSIEEETAPVERFGDWYSQRCFTLDEVTTEQPSGTWDYAEFDLPEVVETPKHVFVVTVIYSDGDTFGHSKGNGKVVAVCLTEAEARTIEKEIREGTFKTRDLMYSFNSWEGYFNTLEDVRIQRMKV